MCYFYLRGWQIGLLATILIGAFTSPLLIYIGSVLVLFPRRAELDACVEPAPMRLNLVFAGLAAYYFALWSLYVVRDIQGPLFGWLAPVESVLPLSFALLLAYLGIGLAMVLNNRRLFQPKSYWTRGNGWAVLGLIATLMAVKLIKAALMGRENDFDSRIYYLILGVASVAKPAVSFLAATIFFGPLVLLAAFLWCSVCGLVHAHGLGLTIVIALGWRTASTASRGMSPI